MAVGEDESIRREQNPGPAAAAFASMTVCLHLDVHNRGRDPRGGRGHGGRVRIEKLAVVEINRWRCFVSPFRKRVAGQKVEVVSHSLLKTRAYSKGPLGLWLRHYASELHVNVVEVRVIAIAGVTNDESSERRMTDHLSLGEPAAERLEVDQLVA